MTAAAIEHPTRMRAIVHDRYGRADVLELREVEAPELPDDRVLVRVRAVSLNKLDWYDVSGTPLLARAMSGLRRPKIKGVGHDFAGTVEAVGKDVHGLAPGDEVFGATAGAPATARSRASRRTCRSRRRRRSRLRRSQRCRACATARSSSRARRC